MNKKGFTLLELLIVIAILAILATVTFVVLNPAQLLAQARDSQRISELASIRTAISLYLATATSTTLDGGGGVCQTNYWRTSVASTSLSGTALTPSTNQTVGGSGWIPVNLTMVSGGSPLAKWPIDPRNTTSPYGYSYGCDAANLTFELNAKMESAAYRNGGTNDVESTDGGNNVNIYETGTDPSLDL